ncbi:conserved protein of unknown function [Tenacibaculum sp. 190130A14a]|uniref:Uncharacterized protein n=1 Tax=Tenacibaculum polynesiense TaxID=3137857 RepID=A0ABP1EZY5_9FLAO
MLKNISSLGKVMGKKAQKSINGGNDDPFKDLCVPQPKEATTCLVPIHPNCCSFWD